MHAKYYVDKAILSHLVGAQCLTTGVANRNLWAQQQHTQGKAGDNGGVLALEGVGSGTSEASQWLGDTPGVLSLYGMGQPALRRGLWSELLAEASLTSPGCPACLSGLRDTEYPVAVPGTRKQD